MKTLIVVSTLMITLFTANLATANDGGPKKTNVINKWLSENVTYPSEAAANAESGTVYVSFELVNGKIVNAVVVEGVSQSLDQTALEMVKNIPASELSDLQPIEHNTYIVPIKFSIK